MRVELVTDFDAYDFPPGTLSPTRHGFEDGKGTIVWESNALVTPHHRGGRGALPDVGDARDGAREVGREIQHPRP